jgi:hypothetical protein
MPNPIAWWFHRLPLSVHKAEVAFTFLEQVRASHLRTRSASTVIYK